MKHCRRGCFKTAWVIFTVMCVIFAGGCKNSNDIDDETDAVIAEPNTIVSDLTQAATEEESSENVEVVEGYEKFRWYLIGSSGSSSTMYSYRPYVANRVPGVVYCRDDDFEEYRNSATQYKYLNQPEGCAYTRICTGIGFGECSQPDFSDEREEYKSTQHTRWDKELWGTSSKENYTSYRENLKYTISKCDVMAVSFALYEDFYDDIPQLTVSIYGVEKNLWDRYVEKADGDTFWSSSYDKLQEECASNNYKDCKLLSSKKVNKTGVYYIDFREMAKEGDFVQYFICFEFDRTAQYTYFISTNDSTYNITSEEKYAEWKKKNADFFLSE